MIDVGKIDPFPEFIEPVRWTSLKKSQVIESLLLGLPSSVIWVEEDRFGLSTVLEGTELISTIKDFIDGRFSLRNLDYFKYLNNRCFEDLSYPEKESIFNASIIVNTMNYNVHPRLKCENFRRLHQGNRYTGMSQSARNYAFKNAHYFLKDISNLFIDEFIQNENEFSSNRRIEKMNVIIQEEILTSITLLYVSDFHNEIRENHIYHADDNILNSEIFLDDRLDIALDKVMMKLDMDELNLEHIKNDMLDFLFYIFREYTLDTESFGTLNRNFPLRKRFGKSFLDYVFITAFNINNNFSMRRDTKIGKILEMIGK